MRNHTLPKGAITALVTPFNEDGSVNFAKMEEMIEDQINKGIDGLLILGTTGESPTLSHHEDDEVVECALAKVNGRVPVIVGSGSNSTQTMLHKSLKYEEMGADALLLISPYYNKANEQGMIRHFTTVADQVHIPCILYNIPGRTGCNISVSAMEELSKHPNIKGVKEASGNLSYAMDLAHLLNDDFVMYSGNDDIIVPMMAAGASGVISVLSNIAPAETHEMTQAFLDGDLEKARAMQIAYLPVIHALFSEVNPIPVKKALNLQGRAVGGYRLPLYEMDEKKAEHLAKVMDEAGLL